MQTASPPATRTKNGNLNAVQKADFPVHSWYRFVLSYPPHLVREYMSRFRLGANDLLLDPFCGTGTTLVEAKKQRIRSIGCDAHPFAVLVSGTKTNWSLDTQLLRRILKAILRSAESSSIEHGLESLSLDALLLQEEKTPVNGFRLTEDEQKILPSGFLSQRLYSACSCSDVQLSARQKQPASAFGNFSCWRWRM
jgi:hypothetical protein